MENYPYESNKKCPVCSEYILITRSRDENKKFCSKECYQRWRSDDPSIEWVKAPYLDKECLFCSKKFVTDRSKNFCSKSCAKKYRDAKS